MQTVNENNLWCSRSSPKVCSMLDAASGYYVDSVAFADEILIDYLIAPKYRHREVVEVGAGCGRLVRTFTKWGCNYTGTDYSAPLYEKLAETCIHWGANSSILDITNGALDQQFDLVFCTQVLLHIHPTLIRRSLLNIKRMSRELICCITWQDVSHFDDTSTTKLQSYSHNYKDIFRELNIDIILELDLYFPANSRKKERTNKCYLLGRM